MLAGKFASYRLHMAGITQNSKQKCLIFIAVLPEKMLFRLEQNEEKKEKNEEKITMKK